MRLVFDAEEWAKTGDIGDNSQFWKPAQIVSIRTHKDPLQVTATVKFEDGRISHGHFTHAMREIEAVIYADTIHDG